MSKTRWGNVFRILGALPIAGLIAGASFAVEASAPTITGFIDTTYNYNFNKPYTQTNELRSFDAKDNNIALNAAQIQFAGTLGDAGYVVKLLAGTDAAAIKGSVGTTDDFLLQEAYMTYKCPMTLINLKAGKFVTPMGIEVIESKDDPTISRGYLFGLAEAYTHVGGMIDRTFGFLNIGAGVVNGWDQTSDNNAGKTLIGKLGLNFGDPVGIVISGLHGPEQTAYTLSPSSPSVVGNNRDSLDIVATVKIIPRTTIFLQANWGTEDAVVPNPYDITGSPSMVRDNWSGAGIQPVVSLTDKFSIGARAEYFYDRFSSRIGSAVAPTTTDMLVDNAFTNFTITPAYKLTDTTTFRLEYRYDTANHKVFTDENGVPKDNSSSIGVQFLQTF